VECNGRSAVKTDLDWFRQRRFHQCRNKIASVFMIPWVALWGFS